MEIYVDAQGNTEGFVASPSPEPASLFLFERLRLEYQTGIVQVSGLQLTACDSGLFFWLNAGDSAVVVTARFSLPWAFGF
ncbi:MAG: hypothetical protein ACRD3T_09945 [Terriglobia bacterium]